MTDHLYCRTAVGLILHCVKVRRIHMIRMRHPVQEASRERRQL